MSKDYIPKLDLAPKRKHPMFLGGDLRDYLQLIGWALLFPQAMKWAIRKSHSYNPADKEELNSYEMIFDDYFDWQERWFFWRIQLQTVFGDYWIQLSACGILLVFVSLYILDVRIIEIFIYLLSIAIGALFGVTFLTPARLGIRSNAFPVPDDLENSDSVQNNWAITSILIGAMAAATLITTGFTSAVSSNIEAFVSQKGVELGISFFVSVVLSSLFLSSAISSITSRTFTDIIYMMRTLLYLLAILAGWLCISFLGTVPEGSIFRPVVNVLILLISIFWLLFGVYALLITAFSILSLRLEEWLVISFLRTLPHYRLRKFSHVTPVPIIGLSNQISTWLCHDWLTALRNINQLSIYTRQVVPTVRAINQSLSLLPDEVVPFRISQMTENLVDWRLIRYVSVSLSDEIIFLAVDGSVFFPRFIKKKLKSNLTMRIDTPARAAATGFWYLYQNQPEKSLEAFSFIRHLPYGQEMYHLAVCLSTAVDAEHLNSSELINRLTIPSSELLRASSWSSVAKLRSVVDDAQIIYQSYSRSARSLALNRALGKLTEIVDKARLIPLAERALLVSIAEDWREKLLAISADIGKVTHTQPVHNPYVAGDPVEGNLFVGRGEVIKQLEELWLMNSQLQSVVLYGHRRMGKTSILKNLSAYLGNNIQVVYINLLNLGAVSEGAGEVLITLTDAISSHLSITPPDDEALLTLPYPTFRRFIQTINQKLKADQGLIIALDEFEKIEELTLASKLSPDFLGFLRGLLQMSPKITFAFAGLHTLEEMTEDYFNPLFASVLPIRIGFFTLPETRELLANPAEDFTLDYRPETLDEIYRLTAGQPYLTQLIGFQLVRHYNHQVFEQGTDRPPIFTPEDLNTVINQSDFFTKGRYYFTGVWNQADQDAPGQQELLKLLAEKEEGRTTTSLRRKSNLSEPEISEALKLLERHDVVAQHEGNWKIIVPLFRQWVLQHQ